jgi:hypothetical protein
VQPLALVAQVYLLQSLVHQYLGVVVVVVVVRPQAAQVVQEVVGMVPMEVPNLQLPILVEAEEGSMLRTHPEVAVLVL